RSRTIVWFRVVAGCRLPARSRADRRPGLEDRDRLPSHRSDASRQEGGARPAGGRAVAVGRGQRRRSARQQAGRQSRSDSIAHEQDAHADAPAHAPGADAGSAGEVKQALRTMDEGTPSTRGSVTETNVMMWTRSIGLSAALAFAATTAAYAQAPS